MESVRQDNRVEIDEIWNSPPPPSITARGTGIARDMYARAETNGNGTNGTLHMHSPVGNGNHRGNGTPTGTMTPYGTMTTRTPAGGTMTRTATLGTIRRNDPVPFPVNGGLVTSNSLVTGNGMGLMLDGIDLTDLWNANTLPGSRNLNSYFP